MQDPSEDRLIIKRILEYFDWIILCWKRWFDCSI